MHSEVSDGIWELNLEARLAQEARSNPAKLAELLVAMRKVAWLNRFRGFIVWAGDEVLAQEEIGK